MRRVFRSLLPLVLLGAALPGARAASGVSLDVSRVELNAQPGGTLSQAVTVLNPGKAGEAEMTVTPYISDFVLPVSGEAQYLTGGSTKNSLGKWMQVTPGAFKLAAKAQQQVRYTINVPANTPPGLYWGVLFFKSDSPQAASAAAGSTNSVSMKYNVDVGQIIYVQVGQPKLDAKLTAASATYAAEGLSISATVKNSGTALVRAAGRALVVDTAGKPVAEIDLGESVALPGYSRAFTGKVSQKLPAGKYQVLIALKYGLNKLFTSQAALEVKD